MIYFVPRRYEGHDPYRSERPITKPRTHLYKGPGEDKREDGVLREVGGLSNVKVIKVDRSRRGTREKKFKQRANESGRLYRGAVIAREIKNNPHP